MDGIWWIFVIGCIWNQLPERFGKWNSVYRFHNRWAHRGVFSSLLTAIAEEQNRDEFKVIDATHIKVHQDACRQRRVVENFFARIKRHRRVNTRYDRLAETFMTFVSLAAIADWVRF